MASVRRIKMWRCLKWFGLTAEQTKWLARYSHTTCMIVPFTSKAKLSTNCRHLYHKTHLTTFLKIRRRLLWVASNAWLAKAKWNSLKHKDALSRKKSLLCSGLSQTSFQLSLTWLFARQSPQSSTILDSILCPSTQRFHCSASWCSTRSALWLRWSCTTRSSTSLILRQS